MQETYPSNFEAKIGFDRIRELLIKNCLSNLGKEWVEQLAFSTDFDAISRMARETEEFVKIIREAENFPVSFYFDLRDSLKKAKVEGTFLEAFELFDLKRSLDTFRGILNFFQNQEDEEAYPSLRALIADAKTFPYIHDRIQRIVSKHGSIRDNASPELASIRREMLQKQASVSRKMQSIIKRAQDQGLVDKDTSVSIRDGRPVIPIASSNKRKLNGIIHDESATGKTAFIEPVEIVEISNEIRELEYAEKREIVKILMEFTADIRPYIDDLIESYHLLGEIDFIRAKAKLAIEVEGIRPVLVNQQLIEWEEARHPVLYLALKKEQRSVVPLNIRLDKKSRILLISGPNAGGKSVCLKTVGILQYMLQCGLLVPVTETSRFGVFNNIFIDIGDEQSLENDLSTYSSHLMNMKYFVRHCNPSSLILIDEFGTGTEPMIGGAIAEALLNQLNKTETFGVITTHYTNLKHFASSAEGIVNGAMLYDAHIMQPLFQLQIGKPGSSFAMEIARKIGLPEQLLKEATDKVGEEHVHFDKHLKDILRDKRYWEKKRMKIRQTEKRLEELEERYVHDLEETQKSKKEIMRKAKEEADSLIHGANKRIEKTIREIKESQAEKEKTKKARQNIEQFKEQLENVDTEKSDAIARKIEKIKQRELNKQKRQKKGTAPASSPEKKKLVEEDKILVGDNVRIVGQTNIGEVVEVSLKNVVVAFGQLYSTLPLKRVEKISKSKAKKEVQKNKTMGVVNDALYARKLKFKPEIDVRGQRAEEALQNIQNFIDEAIMVDAKEVHILHGKGNGILRQLIRQYLGAEPAVRSYRDEHVQFGGAGITVVALD